MMARLSDFYRRAGALGLIAIGLLLIGTVLLWHAVMNRGGIVMPCDRYLAEKPNGNWAKLDRCVLLRLESVAKTSVGKSATEVYIPVRSASETGRVNTRILLASSAAEDLDFVNKANGPESKRANRNAFMAAFGNKIEETRTIEGRILRGSDISDRDRAKLTKTLPSLAPDFVIVEEQERPGLFVPFLALIAGISLGGYKAWKIGSWKSRRGESPLSDFLPGAQVQRP